MCSALSEKFTKTDGFASNAMDVEGGWYVKNVHTVISWMIKKLLAWEFKLNDLSH